MTERTTVEGCAHECNGTSVCRWCGHDFCAPAEAFAKTPDEPDLTAWPYVPLDTAPKATDTAVWDLAGRAEMDEVAAKHAGPPRDGHDYVWHEVHDYSRPRDSYVSASWQRRDALDAARRRDSHSTWIALAILAALFAVFVVWNKVTDPTPASCNATDTCDQIYGDPLDRPGVGG